jgi:hypothetical protein
MKTRAKRIQDCVAAYFQPSRSTSSAQALRDWAVHHSVYCNGEG